MASKECIAEVIAAIKAVYPYYAKETDRVVLAKTWDMLLDDMPDEIVFEAAKQALKECKMPPTPADVIEKAKNIMRAGEPSDEELWGVFTKALRQTGNQISNFNYTCVMPDGKTQGEKAREKVEEIWDELPERLQMYIGSKGELIRMAWYSDEELVFEKNRFLKIMPIMAQRQEYARIAQVALPYKQKTLLEG